MVSFKSLSRPQTKEDSLAEITKSTREGNTNLQKWKMEIKVTAKSVSKRFLSIFD